MMFVVDTNVAIVANGRGTHADINCRSRCVKWLKSLAEKKVIAIDDGNHILDEYKKHLSFSGRPGVGDAFFKHVHDHQHGKTRVRRVAITRSENNRRGFKGLPENDFDLSDQKFLAVAVKAKAVVLNALDSDWDEHAKLMDGLGVEVKQLCPQHARHER